MLTRERTLHQSNQPKKWAIVMNKRIRWSVFDFLVIDEQSELLVSSISDSLWQPPTDVWHAVSRSFWAHFKRFNFNLISIIEFCFLSKIDYPIIYGLYDVSGYSRSINDAQLHVHDVNTNGGTEYYNCNRSSRFVCVSSAEYWERFEYHGVDSGGWFSWYS